MISIPLREGKEVLLDKNAAVTVRLLIGKQVVAFETKVAYRSIQPYTYYHLAYPENITALQIRNSERVDTNISAQIDSDFDILGEWPKPAFINNLSKTGARMSSPVSLGEKGHELLVSFEVKASGVTKEICLPSIIRNIEMNTGDNVGEEGRYVFGIQFVNLTDDQVLTLSSYIYENERR
jgi:c-di-GMP-binding flagellar brake protein YcgR